MLKYNPDIVWKDITSLIPYVSNTKKHPDSQIDKLAGAIAEFGFDQPIVVDGDGVIIKGHGRLLASKKLQLNQVPVLVRTDLTPAQVKAARISDNRIAESEWDEELLKIELIDLQASGFNLELTGFDEKEIAEFISLPESTESDVSYDSEDVSSRADECQQKWKVSLGDLYQCGEHLILCSDCADESAMKRLLGNDKITLLLTDPPYGVKMDKGFSGSDGFNGEGKSIPRRQYSDEWDSERPSNETFKFILSLAKESIIWGGNFFADQLPMSTHWLVWDKHQTMPTFGDCELAWTSIKRKSVKKYDVEYNGLIGKEKERFHPTQKPLKLFLEVIKDYTEEGSVVLDTYSGSGTTLIACEQTKRIARVSERSPEYCAVILERWSILTNQQPVKL